MKTTHRTVINFAIAVTVSFFLFSCQSKDNPSSAQNITGSVAPFTLSTNDTVIGTMMTVSGSTDHIFYDSVAHKIIILSDTNSVRAEAVLYDSSLHGKISMNVISVNGATLDNSGVNYMLNSANVPVKFNGSNTIWHVSASGSIPAITDSLRTPLSPARVSYPTVGATVSKSTPFTVTWSPSGRSDNVYIVLQGPTGWTSSGGTVPDNGFYTFSASDLAGLGTGTVTLSLACGTSKEGTISNGKHYVISSFSAHNVDFNLTN